MNIKQVKRVSKNNESKLDSHYFNNLFNLNFKFVIKINSDVLINSLLDNIMEKNT